MGTLHTRILQNFDMLDSVSLGADCIALQYPKSIWTAREIKWLNDCEHHIFSNNFQMFKSNLEKNILLRGTIFDMFVQCRYFPHAASAEMGDDWFY